MIFPKFDLDLVKQRADELAVLNGLSPIFPAASMHQPKK